MVVCCTCKHGSFLHADVLALWSVALHSTRRHLGMADFRAPPHKPREAGQTSTDLGSALNAFNSNSRNVIPSQSFSCKRKCLATNARESLRETLRSSERFCLRLRALRGQSKFVFSPVLLAFYRIDGSCWVALLA